MKVQMYLELHFLKRQPYQSIFYDLMAKCHLSLAEFKQLKAIELKNFLLYTAMVVLKDIVSHQIYHHFLALSVAVTIMVNDKFF